MNQHDEKLLLDIVELTYNDPALFAKLAFKWDEDDLKGYEGLDTWQEEFCDSLAEEIEHSLATNVPARLAVASGHGIGKSALLSIIILWFMTTRRNARIRATANNETQIRSVLWAELALWHERCIFKHWFQWEATRFSKTGDDRATWFAEAVTYNENKPDAIAGLHGKHCLLIFDEASGIPQSIWEAVLGVFTRPGNAHICFGNPINPSGGFFDCFHDKEMSKLWKTRNISSLDTKLGNTPNMRQIYNAFGPDDDRTRRRVLGQFPRQASDQLIPTEDINDAIDRHLRHEDYNMYPVTMGLDIAYKGDDESVICVRQGPKILEMKAVYGRDTYEVADMALNFLSRYPQCTALYMDEIGVGVGVLDRLRRHDDRVVGINVGRPATNKRAFGNIRMELADKVREWIQSADIPDIEDMKREMMALEYSLKDNGQMYLIKKTDLKPLIGRSSDYFDSIALTFAYQGDYYEAMMGEDEFDAMREQSFRTGNGRSGVTGY